MNAIKGILAVLFVFTMTFFSTAIYAADGDREPIPPEKARVSLRASVHVLGLQTELPIGDNGKAETRDQTVQRYPQLRISSETATFILYGAVLVMVIVVFLSLPTNLWSFSRSRQLSGGDSYERAPVAAAVRMEKAQVEAEELAYQGNFAEAMHVLLLQSVDELRRRLCVSISVSLTSRDILRRIALPPEGLAVFSDIISRVEISYFGTYQPGVEEYRACRRSFDTLTDLLRQGEGL